MASDSARRPQGVRSRRYDRCVSEQALDATPPLGRIQARALPDAEYDALLDMLTWGRLEPDAPLAIDRLARALDVSPTPVREALARLENTGLVRRTAHRGYRVAPPMSNEQMAELADARLVIEVGATERAMRHVDELLPDLERAFARHEQSAHALAEATPEDSHDRLRTYFEEDWAFHQVILDHCGNRYLARSVNALSFSVHRMRQTVGMGVSDAPIAVSEHRAILEAVRSRDATRAVETMRSHVSNVRVRSSETSEEGT